MMLMEKLSEDIKRRFNTEEYRIKDDVSDISKMKNIMDRYNNPTYWDVEIVKEHMLSSDTIVPADKMIAAKLLTKDQAEEIRARRMK